MSEVVPEGWEVCNFGKYAKVRNGFAFKSSDFKEKGNGSFPIIRMSNLKKGTLDLSDAVYVDDSVVSGLEPFALKPNDFVFPKHDGTKWTLNERVFDNLMEESEVDKSERKLTWTSTRHFYGTKRIEEGVDVYLLAEQMGTGINMIERHYGHRKIKSQTSKLNIFRKRSKPKKM